MKVIKAFAQLSDLIISLGLLIASIYNLFFLDKWFGLALLVSHVIYQTGHVLCKYLLFQLLNSHENIT